MTELPDPKQFGDYGEWPGRTVLDAGGERLGEVREIYLDDATDRPEWVLVERGDREPRFVPLADARVEDDALRVAQTVDRIEAAPSLEPTKQLTLEQERELYAHYGVQLSDEASDSILPATGGETGEGQATGGGDEAAATAEPVTTGGADDPAAGGEPVADEPDSTVSEKAAISGDGEAGASDGPASGVAAAAALAGGADVSAASAGPAVTAAPAAPVDAPQLPAPGDTSEPEDQGPMVPPRPEPVAPDPLRPPEPSGGPLAVVKKKPVPIAAGAAAVVAAVLLILRRRS